MLILLEKNKALPRGVKFIDPHSGIEFPRNPGVHLYSWDSFLSEIKLHRSATNGDLDIGWEQRVEHEFCCQNPQLRSAHYLPSKDLSITIGDLKRYGYVIKKNIENGAKTVSQEEANRRAEICMRCPYRIETGICNGCNGLVDFFEGLFFGKKETPYDDSLGNCGVCKCYNKVAVHYPVDVQMVEGVSPEDFPEYCWKRES